MSKTKGKKSKISKIKTRNIQGGKLTKGKKTGSKNVQKARRKLVMLKKMKERVKTAQNGKPVHEEMETRDVLDMLDEEDLSYIRNTEQIRNQFALNPKSSKSEHKHSKQKRRQKEEDIDFENRYEKKLSIENVSTKKFRSLLPIKTKNGLQMLQEEEDPVQDPVNHIVTNESSFAKSAIVENSVRDRSADVISTAMLLAVRQQKLSEYKMKIGILSASFLEDPENRMRNLDSLLAMLVTSDSGVSFTVPKLAAMSLVSVFQDVLPAYSIKHHNQDGIKLKQQTKELQGQEVNLLRHYKTFLQRLEKIVGKYVQRKKSQQTMSETETSLGHIALDCMCKMLVSHPYFNLATNIINFVIPFLNNWSMSTRQIVSGAIRTIFRIDRRGEISYEIVRRINILVKAKFANGKSGFVRRDVIDVLLALRIKEVDLEKEKKEEIIPKGKMSFEERRMLSKRQRKKAKEMVLLEKELLETSAEENKSKKSHYLTEITKHVFTMYFRAIKTTPNAALLSAVLEGLAKFAHIISVDFFDDLIKVLNRLLSSGELQQRQTLLCIATVLAVLDGQGQALALDPTVFHKSLYSALIKLRCGMPESNVALTLRCIHLATGKKKMPSLRAAAFAKRLCTVILQLEHHDSMAALLELKNILRVHLAASGLLDSEGSLGSGVYLPELDDPDHAMAQSSTLWEFTTLAGHYHPWVCQIVKNIVQVDKIEPLPKEIAQFSAMPEVICQKYDPYQTMDFTPSLPEPQPSTTVKNMRRSRFSTEFQPKTSYFRKLMSVKSIKRIVHPNYDSSILNKIKFLEKRRTFAK